MPSIDVDPQCSINFFIALYLSVVPYTAVQRASSFMAVHIPSSTTCWDWAELAELTSAVNGIFL